MLKLSNSANHLVGQKMFQILSKAQKLEQSGKNIIHLEIGDPDFDTPEHINNAAINSINNGDTHYTNSLGILELREYARCVTEKSRFFKPDLDQILVTPGANFQIYLALACLVNIDDEVIVPNPSFVSYSSIVNFIGAKVVSLPLKENNNFKIDPDALEKRITKLTKVIIINSPNNPTGSILSKSDIEKIYEIASKHNIAIISDEIYSRMLYEDSDINFYSPSMIDNCKERTILINGFSKSYAMTGWRIGVLTAPNYLIQKMGLLLESTLSCVPKFTQYAALEALKADQEEISAMVGEFRKRRDYIINRLNKIDGFSCVIPHGAFYAFPNITRTNLKSEELADLLLEKLDIAVCPGTIFGSEGEGFLRFCYANSIENIEVAMNRMENFFGANK